MSRLYFSSFSFGFITLVIVNSILITLISVKPVHSCHRRVEYHYYKRPPHKGWGWQSQQHGHGGGGHKGYGGHGHQKGYQQKGHDGGGHGHKGYDDMKGYGHQMKGYGHEMKGHDHGMKGYGHQKGYHDDDDNHGQGGYESSPMRKGMKYKHSSYEMTTFGNKGNNGYNGDGQTGYSHNHNQPHHQKQGYGISGPYPNTGYGYLRPSVDPSSYNEIGSDTSSSSLGVADVANYIRSSKNPQLVNGGRNIFLATPILMDPLPLSSDNKDSKNTNGERLANDGNFDLNLDFNGDDVPDPFRRSDSSKKSGKKKKKISSTFKAPNGFDTFIDSGQ